MGGLRYPPDAPDGWFIARGLPPRAERIAAQFAAAARRRSEWKSIDRAAIIERDRNRCRYCGAGGVRLALDHVIPFSRGGATAPDNLVAACKPCNSRKKDRTPEEAGMQLLPIAEVA